MLAMLQNTTRFTPSKNFYVKPNSGSDGNSGLSPRHALKTLVRAKALATADNGDAVFLIAESNTAASTTDYQSTALDWSKDGVNLIGVGANPFIGQRSRIAQTSTVKTIEDLFTVSADNCYIEGIEVFQGVASSIATAPRAVVVSGQRNKIVNCQLSGIGDTSLDVAGARSLHVSGSENTFENCYLGLDTVIRGTALCEVSVTTAARTKFKDCMINSYTSLSTFKALIATSTDRFVLLDNCILSCVQGITSSVAPTGAIGTATLNGQVWMLGGGVFGYADVTTADNSAVLVLTHGALAANIIDMGVAKGTDVAA